MTQGPDPTQSPDDLDLIGTKYAVAPYWREEIALLLRTGASDDDILIRLKTPDEGYPSDDPPIPLTDEQCRALIAELRGNPEF